MNTGSELDELSNDSLVILLKSHGPKFSKVNKINAKVPVKIKWKKKNHIWECEFQSRGLLTSVK